MGLSRPMCFVQVRPQQSDLAGFTFFLCRGSGQATSQQAVIETLPQQSPAPDPEDTAVDKTGPARARFTNPTGLPARDLQG